MLAEMNMGSAVYGTIVPANGTIFLNNRSQLFAIGAEIAQWLTAACAIADRLVDRRSRLMTMDRIRQSPSIIRSQQSALDAAAISDLRSVVCDASALALSASQSPSSPPPRPAAPAAWRQFRGTPSR